MNFTVNYVEEQEDGSAIVEINMDEDAKRFLIERGFIDMLQTALAKDPIWWKDDNEDKPVKPEERELS
jgi:hypothetical protein